MNFSLKKAVIHATFALTIAYAPLANAIVAADGIYYSLLLGGAYSPSITSSAFTTLPAPVVQPVNALKFKPGFTLSGEMGVKYGSPRLGVQFFWGQMAHRYFRNANTGTKTEVGGATTLLGGSVNAYLDFDFIAHQMDADEFIPYVGIGAGVTRVRTDFKVFTPKMITSESKHVFQAIAGFLYNADSYTSIGMEYRGYFTGDVAVFGKPMQVHTVSIVITNHTDGWFFD